MRKGLLFLTTFCMLILGTWACSSRTTEPHEKQQIDFRGKLFGVITCMRDSLPEDARLEKYFPMDSWIPIIGQSSVKFSLLPNGEYEIRRTYPVDSLELYVDRVKAELFPDGSFLAKGVTPGSHNLNFFIRGMEVRQEQCQVVDSEVPQIDIRYMPMPCHDMSHATALGNIPCLDNNGLWPGGFTFSDCWTNMVFGNPLYSWMCWSEAMNVIHDHHGNIWCDGSHNCSLFVHGWDWNKQFWHRHYGPWKPTW